MCSQALGIMVDFAAYGQSSMPLEYEVNMNKSSQ